MIFEEGEEGDSWRKGRGFLRLGRLQMINLTIIPPSIKANRRAFSEGEVLRAI
jgi:hypothetical protein